ncbi:MAG: PorP/SprF family type IX secretion system membrane protein [Ferruginibacter sp.]
MIRKIFFTAVLIFSFSMAHAQDINFSQFYELPLLRNPALAGLYKGDVRITSAWRSQWASVSGVPFKTQALGAEMKFGVSQNNNDYLALGVQITNDQAGDSKLGKTQFLPVLTFHKSINEDNDSYISLGFIGGAVQQRFDPTQLKFDDQFVNGAYSSTNPTNQTFTNTNVTYYDCSVGMLYSTSFANDIQFYLGAAYYHFTKPKVAFSYKNDVRLNNKTVINIGLAAPVSDYDKLILYADVFQQGGNKQAQGGFMYRHDLLQEEEDMSISISAGSFLRWNDAIIPVIKLDYYKIGIGFTYDVNISKLKAASQMRGGFEATLSYRSFLNMRNSSSEKVRCPVAF